MTHLNEVGETYWQHLKFAMLLALKLHMAGGAAIIHAIFPFMLQTKASDTLKEINGMLESRKVDPENEDKELFI